MNDIIRSSQNKNIKFIKSLHNKKYRDEYQAYIIEGEKLFTEALDYSINFKFAVFAEAFKHMEELVKLYSVCLDKGINTLIVDEKIFKDISETQTPQGVMGIVYKSTYELDEILQKASLNLIVLDEIRDPGNLGTIIRTADACNVHGVLLSKGCADLYNSKTIRATMGSIFHLPVIDDIDIEKLIITLNNKGIQTICADPYGVISTFELPAYDKNAIVIGNESKGVNDVLKSLVTHSVKIPMPGKAESLNAGIAAALMMYEIAVRKPLSQKQ